MKTTSPDLQQSFMKGIFGRLFDTKHKKKISDLSLNRNSFLNVLSNKTLFNEFREVAKNDEGMNLVKFIQKFFALEKLAASASDKLMDTTLCAEPTRFFAMVRFLSSRRWVKSSFAFELPLDSQLTPHYLVFYATFLAPGCPCPCFVVDENVGNEIARNLELGALVKIKSNIFDSAIDQVLESLYNIWFPRFIVIKKIGPLNIRPQNSLALSNRSSYAASSASEEAKRMIFGRKRSVSAVDSGPSEKLNHTKGSFVRVLFDPILLRQFELQVEADHCTEALMFFESFLRASTKLSEQCPCDYSKENEENHPNLPLYPAVILQYLHFSSKDNSRDMYIPNELYAHFLLLFATFVVPESPHECNLSHQVRTDLGKALSSTRIPVSVFSSAILEILDQIFLNSFKNFTIRGKK